VESVRNDSPNSEICRQTGPSYRGAENAQNDRVMARKGANVRACLTDPLFFCPVKRE
jgi:hypothetical protein